ncbi:MAG: BTAD domain-containing putative transcriptional regulator [Ilumatobacteraceae bacterium]
MAVRVELAGRVRLVTGGVAVDGRAMGGTIAQRVLGALALAGGPVSRDELGDAVWGEALPRTWETALRGAVSKLRRGVQLADPTVGELVRTAFGAYQLDPDVSVDVLDAARLVQEAELLLPDDPSRAAAAGRDAARVLGRPLLAGLDGEWVDRERRRLVPICARAHLTHSAAATALGDHATAIGAARAAVGCDPYAEVAHRRLMTAHAAGGDRAAALAAYRQCRELLVAELGVEPSADTDAVRRAVLEEPQGPRRGPVLPTGLPVSLARDLPLAGREVVLGEVVGRWRLGRSSGCVLVGPAGVGKSRLAAEAADVAHRHGVAVVHAGIEPDDLGGLGAFAELLGQLDVAWPPPDLGAASVLLDRSVLAGAAVDALRQAASRQRLVVVLDDLHWADRSTTAILVHVVAAEIAGLFVLATARDEWLEPSLSRSAELADRLDVIHVPALDHAGVVQLVATWAGHRPGDAVLDAIVTRSAGNPFYVLAVLQDIAGRGGNLSHGLDVSSAVLARVPSGVRGIVDAALGRIGPAGRAYAEAAAVLGDEFRPVTVSAIIGTDSVARVQRLLDARLVVHVPQDPGRLRWAHALVRDAVLAGLASSELRQVHRRAADAVDQDPDAGPAVVLRHLLAAAEPADAARIAELSTVVAADLTERGRGDEAATVLADSLRVIEHAGGAIRAPLLMSLAMAELSIDHVVSGRRHLREAATAGLAVGDVSFLDSWWSAVSSRAAGGADEEMVGLVERVVDVTEPGSRRRATALGWLTVELAVGPELRRAHRAGCDALAIARRLDDAALLRQTVHAWHLAARVEVPAAERRTVVEATLALRAPTGKLAADLLGWVTLAGDCLQLGDAAAAAAAVDVALVGTAGFGATHLRWIALRSDVMLATKDGRLEHAEAVGAEAAAMAAAMPWPEAPSIQVIQHILLRYHQGRLDEVQPFIAAVAEAAPEQVGVLIALAFIETELGHEHAGTAVADVSRRLSSLTSAAAWLGMTSVVLESMAKVRHSRTAEIAATLAPWSGEHAVITTLGYFGAVARVLGLAAAATGDLDRARPLLRRAIDQHDAIGSPPYATRTRAELAVLDSPR